MSKPKIAVFKFTSCSGCQLEFLNIEDQLLDLVGAVDIAYFVEAKRENAPGPYDVAFVEGAISTPEEVERIKQIREQSSILVAVGACATSGGVPSIRNWKRTDFLKSTVYPEPSKVHTLEWATGIGVYVPVDLELRGCPFSRQQLLDAVVSLLLGKTPAFSTGPVCTECKLKDNVCLLVDKGEPCLGPVTVAGCGALCPSNGRACYGCFGPSDDPNVPGLVKIFEEKGLSRDQILRVLRHVSGYAEPMRKVSEQYE